MNSDCDPVLWRQIIKDCLKCPYWGSRKGSRIVLLSETILSRKTKLDREKFVVVMKSHIKGGLQTLRGGDDCWVPVIELCGWIKCTRKKCNGFLPIANHSYNGCYNFAHLVCAFSVWCCSSNMFPVMEQPTNIHLCYGKITITQNYEPSSQWKHTPVDWLNCIYWFQKPLSVCVWRTVHITGFTLSMCVVKDPSVRFGAIWTSDSFNIDKRWINRQLVQQQQQQQQLGLIKVSDVVTTDNNSAVPNRYVHNGHCYSQNNKQKSHVSVFFFIDTHKSYHTCRTLAESDPGVFQNGPWGSRHMGYFLIYICQRMKMGWEKETHTDKLIKWRSLLSHCTAHRGKVIIITHFPTNRTVNHTEELPPFLHNAHPGCNVMTWNGLGRHQSDISVHMSILSLRFQPTLRTYLKPVLSNELHMPHSVGETVMTTQSLASQKKHLLTSWSLFSRCCQLFLTCSAIASHYSMVNCWQLKTLGHGGGAKREKIRDSIYQTQSKVTPNKCWCCSISAKWIGQLSANNVAI